MPAVDDVPSPAELSVWLNGASPAAASGTFRWSGTGDGFGHFAYMGEAPAFAVTAPDVDIAFVYAADGRWRLEQDGDVLAVSDGTMAVGVTPHAVTSGPALVVLPGPAELLTPRVWTDRGETVVRDGTVAADERLGRKCWRWERDEETWWVDHETGTALARRTADGLVELTAVSFGPVPETAFDVPAGLLDRAAADRDAQARDREPDGARNGGDDGRDVAWTVGWHDGPDDEGDDDRFSVEELERPKHCAFTVPWWPRGSLVYPESGEPAVPEALLVLNTGEGRPFWLGVTRQGRQAPAKRGADLLRWSGDGWEFALSWRGELDPDDAQRIARSVPSSWDLA